MDNFIEMVVMGIIAIVIVLICVLIFITVKDKAKKMGEQKEDKKSTDELEEKKAQRSIFKFMEFDTVEDNMIVQDGGKRYLMIIECKGVNYDLLSEVERNSVEMGFIGFLNTLKFEIQLYVQTRKVNLAQSTAKYRERLRAIESDMREEEEKYEDLVRNGMSSKDDILKALKNVTKKRNLYEYAKDVIETTEKMSEDTDLTTKEYYIVVPYYTDEITSTGDYDKREIGSMAFSELYTRAQSLVNALSECDVRGKILNSQEIVELLFISYNREQHDTYDFDEYMNQSSYNSFYTVSQDVLRKRIEALDIEIKRKANERAVDAFRRSNKKEEQLRAAVEERETKMQEYVNLEAERIVNSQASVIGKTKTANIIRELELMNEEDENDNRELNVVEENNVTFDSENTIPTVEEEDIERKKELRRKKLMELSPEERARRARIIKKRKMMREKEAKKNG